ncbi:MAG: phenylalanine--tRNA ligase subunit alpha [Candidatus Paceibacterota bacterium]
MNQEQETNNGHLHPISLVVKQIEEIFSKLGFSFAYGPQIETEHYNFDALNIPPDHPARDLWDTFWLKENNLGELLRTHTSNVQIHHMESHEPPIKIIAPGKVFRYEATDATHETQFFQVEGLLVDEAVTMGNLKGTLEHFFSEFFGDEMEVRLRPSFFPFVEPGVEVDMRRKGLSPSDEADSGAGKDNPWIEVLGAGMVHPRVLENVGIDPRQYQGFAFGVGIDRLLMLKYGISDIRLLYQGDLRVTEQF